MRDDSVGEQSCIFGQNLCCSLLNRESIPPIFERGIKDDHTGSHLRNERPPAFFCHENVDRTRDNRVYQVLEHSVPKHDIITCRRIVWKVGMWRVGLINKIMAAVGVAMIAVLATAGSVYFFGVATDELPGMAIIEDTNGDRIAVEPTSGDVWAELVELYHGKGERWIGGIVEVFLFIRPDPNYPWGFRFTPESITVAEVTAEGLQTTIRDISEDLEYWIRIGHPYVFARVAELREGGGTEEPPDAPSDVIKFEAVVNGMRRVDVFVCVNLSDGLTAQEAELIAGTTFSQVKGEWVWRRLKALMFDDTQITAHYAWGNDETDLGHTLAMAANLTTLKIAVDHCF